MVRTFVLYLHHCILKACFVLKGPPSCLCVSHGVVVCFQLLRVTHRLCQHRALSQAGDTGPDIPDAVVDTAPDTDILIYKAPSMTQYLQAVMQPLTHRVRQVREWQRENTAVMRTTLCTYGVDLAIGGGLISILREYEAHEVDFLRILSRALSI